MKTKIIQDNQEHKFTWNNKGKQIYVYYSQIFVF